MAISDQPLDFVHDKLDEEEWAIDCAMGVLPDLHRPEEVALHSRIPGFAFVSAA